MAAIALLPTVSSTVYSGSSLTKTNPQIGSVKLASFSKNGIRKEFGLISMVPSRVNLFRTVNVFASTTVTPSVEKVDWKVKREVILKNNVKSISAKEASKLEEQGYVILDVRPSPEYDELHPSNSKNAQVYRLIKNWTAWDNLRRAGFAFFGIFNGTEENPDFIQEIEALGLAKDAKIIVACSVGGTTKPTQSFPEGKQSRSLIAAYKLILAGYKNVTHLEGGVYSWFTSDLPVKGSKASD